MSNTNPAGLNATQGSSLQSPPAVGAGGGTYKSTLDTGTAVPKATHIPRVSTSYDTPDYNTTQTITNSIYQNLMGRDATPAEVAKYHQMYVQYAQTHPTNISHSVVEAVPGQVPLERNSSSTATGLSEQSFIDNLIRGNAEAKDYQAATGYMDAVQNEISKARQGAF